MKKQISFKVVVIALAIVGLAIAGLVGARQFEGFNSPYPVGAGGGGAGTSQLSAE
jgi:hypothetical protein